MATSAVETATATVNTMPEEKSTLHRRAVLLIALYVAALLGPLALASTGGGVPAGQFIKQIALGLGLAGLMIIATSFILAARYYWVTDPFGLDAVMLFHRRMAIVGFCAILLHIVLLSYLNIGLLTRLWLPWHLQLGRIAILLLTAQIIVSIYRSQLRVEFEKWRIMHRLVGLAVLVVAFTHGLLSSEAFAPWPLRLVVFIIIAAAFWSLVWRQIIWPLRLKDYRYVVESVDKIIAGVWQIKLRPGAGGQSLRYLPGQFAFFHFNRSGVDATGEEHAWTIASSPSETDGLMLAVKELGDFTRTIGMTKPGDVVTVHGPFGRFSHRLHQGNDELVFIAGGIGITPFRSMIRWLVDRAENRRVLLLYANKSADDIAFFDELEHYSNDSGGRVRVVHVLSRAADQWQGEKGRIDIALIKKYCAGDLNGKTFWICGPAAFTATIIQALRGAGVAEAKIHNEAFCLLHAPVQADGRGRRLKTITGVISFALMVMVLLFALIRTDFLAARAGANHHTRHGASRHRVETTPR